MIFNVAAGRKRAPSLTPTIIGYEWNYGDPDPHLTRLEHAVGRTMKVGFTNVTNGFSDFDSIYPYSGMKKCVLNTNGTVYAYQGESGFSTTPASGREVMIEIPKFYYKRTQDTATTRQQYLVSDVPTAGFFIHPMFDRPGGIRDKIYVSAYEVSNGYRSIAGVQPYSTLTKTQLRTGCRAKGAGWNMMDFATVIGLSELMKIEMGTNFTQWYDSWTEANGWTLTGLFGNVIGRDPPNRFANTGATDVIAFHTGNSGPNTPYPDWGSSHTAATLAMKWRNLENWYGNTGTYIDGAHLNGTTLYYTLNLDTYAPNVPLDHSLSFPLHGSSEWPTNIDVDRPNEGSVAYRLGFDPAAPWAAVASDLRSFWPLSQGIDEDNYLTDYLYIEEGPWKVPLFGGAFDFGWFAGVHAWLFYDTADTINWGEDSCRLMYIPQV